jgi:hypothetical protein
MRKFYIGIISLLVVLVIFLIYSRLEKDAPTDTADKADVIHKVEDSNAGDFENQVGMIGDVGVGTVQKARYVTRDENQQVKRIWGFDRLLHQSGQMWQLEKPYMNIYKRNFVCYITADSGRVLVETAVGKSTPRDATFTSNVVVHIVPDGSSSIKESHIYLDDITFLSEKSLLSTENSVRFVSDDARMLGRGLELVYDDTLERIEYLWIFDLQHLRVKSSGTGFLSRSKNPPGTGGGSGMQKNEESAAASDKTTPQTALAESVSERKEVERYKCLFSENVLIDSPEQLIFAYDEITINDILWSGKSQNRSRAETDARAVQTDRPNTSSEQPPPEPETADAGKGAAENPDEKTGSSDQTQDITVTCDNGFIVALKDAPEFFGKLHTNLPGSASSGDRRPQQFEKAKGRNTFFARKIDYNTITEDVIATGESELRFYTSDLIEADSNQHPLPATVTSRQMVKFLPSANQAVFKGNCQCELLQIRSDIRQQYKLLAPRLTVELAENSNSRASQSTTGIEHFTADGGLVRLQSRKTAGRQTLAWVKLEASRFDYDPDKGLFTATGPGIIEMDNSKTPDSATETGKLSLRKPCYAVVREYDTLKYFIEKNRLIADAPSEGLIIDYFPVVDGKTQFDKHATATARHIRADLVKTASGQSSLSTLTASGGIVYKDEDRQFEGSTLFFDAGKSLVTIRGDEFRPCQYNGVSANSFEWDLKTDKVNADIAGPAVLQLQ